MTIRWKLILASAAILSVMLLAFAFLVYSSSRDSEIARLDAFLNIHAMRLATEVEEQWAEGSFPATQDFLAIQAEGLVAEHFRLLALDGTVVIPDTVLASIPAGADSPAGGHRGAQTVELGGERYRVLSVPAEVQDTVKYSIQVASTLSGVEANLEHLQLLFLFSIPTGLLISSLAILLITRAAFTPLAAMIETGRTVSVDNLDARLALPAVHDEIRLLGETLNSMIERIHRAFQSQRQFVADASHEIRTPLTILQSELEHLRGRASARRSKSGLRLPLAQVERLVKMTDGMLLLSRLDGRQLPLTPGSVRIDELLIECIQTMQGLFRRKGVHLRLRIEEAMEIRGDGDMIKRVFLNLLENALKYTRKGGTVTVFLSLEPGTSLPVHVAIKDNGCGIAEKDLPFIFTRFYRGDNARAGGSGSGLGLAIAKEIVALHQGTLAVRTEEGRGSVFSVRLPSFS